VKLSLKPHDLHLVVNAAADLLKCFDAFGRKKWTVPAHNEGVAGPGWRVRYGDTPPGVYRVTRVERIPRNDADADAYGPAYLYLEPVSGPAAETDRSGIGLHGGGSRLPAPLAPRQGWAATHGCVRTQNEDLMTRVVPAVEWTHSRGGTVWLTVTEE
jgi:hypothetical protein